MTEHERELFSEGYDAALLTIQIKLREAKKITADPNIRYFLDWLFEYTEECLENEIDPKNYRQ